MRAAYIEHTGPPEVILVGELPRPEPGPGQVLVRVKAAGINPIDLYVRSGQVAMPLSFPQIVGSDVAGVVERTGEGVTRFAEGDRVWGSNRFINGQPGSAAEYAAIDEEWLYNTPDGSSDIDAAGQALVGITAHLGLVGKAQIQPGETLYVPGGTGGVGSMVVQMAKASGAKVATSAGTSEKQEICRKLGADLALNYKTDKLAERLREFAPDGIDVWFETQREPQLEQIVPLLRKRGRILLIAGRAARPVLPLGQFYPRDGSILGYAMFNASADEQRRCAEDMNRWTAEGKLKPLVGRTFPLADTAAAHRFLEENTIGGAGSLMGKVVIIVDPSTR